jgi:hypothetical protein
MIRSTYEYDSIRLDFSVDGIKISGDHRIIDVTVRLLRVIQLLWLSVQRFDQ